MKHHTGKTNSPLYVVVIDVELQYKLGCIKGNLQTSSTELYMVENDEN